MEPLIAIHALAASLVITLGPVQFLRPRRDRAHRLIGRVWVGAMAITCLSSFGIHPHGFNGLHGLAVFTLVSVTAGVIAIRRGSVVTHRMNMLGSYIGTLVAFGFAVALPNRAISRLAADDPVALALIVALVLATSAAVVSAALVLTRPSRRTRTTQPSRPTQTPASGQSVDASRVGSGAGAGRAPEGRPNSARIASTSTSPGSPPAS